MMSPRTEITPPTPERPTHNRDTDSAPPPPPPKDSPISERSEPTTPEPKSQAEEQKVRTEDLRPQVEKEKRDASDADDSEPEPSNGKAVEAGLPSRSRPGRATVEDDDDGGSFQEVAL